MNDPPVISTRSTSRRAQIIVTVPAILELPISVEDEDKTKERTTESEIEGDDDDDYNIVFLKSQMVTTNPLVDPNIKYNEKQIETITEIQKLLKAD